MDNMDKKPLILVVDDDRATRTFLRYLLEGDGYQVIEAENGAVALNIYKQSKPNMVLMDAMMPLMDGFTACAQLNKLPASNRVPVLMITSLDDHRSLELSFRAGAADFITKPIQWTVLRNRISRLLRARQNELLLDITETTKNTIISNTPDGIIIIDDHNLIKSFNPAAEKIFGYPPDEVIGLDVKLLLPNAYRKQDIVDKSVKYSYNNKQLFNANREVMGQRKDGCCFPARLIISGFYAGERLLTVRDISEQKMAESKLRQAAKIFESISEGLAVTNTDLIIESINPAFTEITGYKEDEVVGKTPSFLWSGPQNNDFYQNISAKPLEACQWCGEIWQRCKNGEYYPVWVSISAIKDEMGVTNQYIMLLTDITEQLKLAQERQRLLEQSLLTQRLASLGTMSAGIAHEISQPLNAIKVTADGMLYWHKRNRFPEKDKVKASLEKISAQAGRIEEIVKNIRSLMSIGHSFEVEACCLNKAVNNALNLLRGHLSSHGITLKKDLALDLPDLLCNANRLEEIIVNLLVNSMHAVNGANRPAKEITCSTWTEGGKAVLEISDNGTGISDEIKERVFDPFFSTKKAGEGMGLGLFMVQSIVTGCKGQIKLDHNDQGGATFRLEFPIFSGREVS